ncbi:vancomycin high temperature exclusion protein [Brumimicrobium glaciale]|jgi:SanA protein|uniref:Vancomycin high temperature exclusion protein n=1 Tax=Brumimicrobium glaciale TaxID=200475 RepID=A0A4Q4KJL2_9FLAO|nr:ElyC/SanA/YdcF family protein [Brumimicrobium glaciale]RYM33442.1 vancomycin high temperature exclusion protein [Brumimicrobium glaciale]
MKKRLGSLLIVLVLPVLFAFFSNMLIENTADGKTFFEHKKIESNKVGLLLGTSKYRAEGGINLYFKYRIDAAVRLYESGKINFILVSGDNSTEYYNEPEAFKAELIKRGIPVEKIFLDYAGFRTLDSVVRAKEVFGQSRITIISQKFHNERAIYLAEHYGLNAIAYNAKDVSKNYGFKTQVREYFARSKAILDVLFGVEPKFLGDKIEIK